MADGREPQKTLSICMMGRDDNYMRDFKYRVATTLNHFAYNVNRLGRSSDVELILADWGSTPPLADTLPLTSEAVDITRIVYVDPVTINETQDGDFFHTARAINVALRRAEGRFVLLTASDQLLPVPALDTMLRLIDGQIPSPFDVEKTFFVMPRVRAPSYLLDLQPRASDWDGLLLSREYTMPREPYLQRLHFGASGGFLMHRDILHDIRGVDETQSGWGWSDIDLSLRATETIPFVWLSAFGIEIYHLEHAETASKPRAARRRSDNRMVYSALPSTNESSWGLGDRELSENKARPKTEDEVAQEYERYRTGEMEDRTAEYGDNLVQELLSDPVRQTVVFSTRRFLQNNWRATPKTLSSLMMLSWYATRRHPRRFLELGNGAGLGAGVVASGFPAAEVYVADKWDGLNPANSPLRIARCLKALDFQGKIHYLNGETNAAIRRLRQIVPAPFELDLVMVRWEDLGKGAPDVIAEILSYTRSEGALVVTEDSGNVLPKWLSGLSEKSNQYTLVSSRAHTAALVIVTGDATRESSAYGATEAALEPGFLKTTAFRVAMLFARVQGFYHRVQWRLMRVYR